MTPPVTDGAFARWLAARAGEELLRLRDELGFDDPAALGAAGDKRAHDLLIAELARWRPGDGVLSEEGVYDGPALASRLRADRVWIVDPLDGTREFGERGRTDWAVHVGLWSRAAGTGGLEAGTGGLEAGTGGLEAGTGGLAAGAIALPAQRRTLATDDPPAYPPRAGPATGPTAPEPRLAVSRTRPAGFLAAVAAELGGELVPMGSAGAKIAAVITGEVDAYLHAGGQYEWDSAAPVAVAGAAGLHTSRIDGSPLRYNQPDPRVDDLLVCRRDLARELLAAVARQRPEKI